MHCQYLQIAQNRWLFGKDDQSAQAKYLQHIMIYFLLQENYYQLPFAGIANSSFIGVSGFLISCATCLAISRHAPSLSLLASSLCAYIQFLHHLIIFIYQLSYFIFTCPDDLFICFFKIHFFHLIAY